MARITVLGGSGYAGAGIVAEAAKRGHEVTSLSRGSVGSPVTNVQYVAGSALDAAVLDEVLADRDVIIVALSPRGDMAGKLEGIVEDLIHRLAGTPTRLGHVGGMSSLLIEEGGQRFWDVFSHVFTDEQKPEVESGLHVLEMLKASPETLDWFYISPPRDFGSWLDTPSKGAYVLGGDILLKDAAGNSTISANDLAIAVVDEIEKPAHHRLRFTAIH
ncbi:NAD(P)-dependent oxidoreductase [Cryptosporangium phraense]|uniref:NAD(P)-dependent oxidoreductase n=1 Tax=Cryptosporangium phraense TaxID=2593070 RepID=UPI00197ABF62|nr:NAD(P)H-binding protein [Cryptosporangium phraense]